MRYHWQGGTANTPRTTCTFLVGKFASVRELKERLGFGVCSYMPLGVVWLEEQPGDNIFFWISTVFSVAALENWKSNWKWEQEITFAVRSPCVLRCGTIWAYLRDRHDQAVQNHCSNLNLATVNGFNIQKRVLTVFIVITVRFEFWILNFSIQSTVCGALSNELTPMFQTVML